ncbi:hypothetical protein Celaphus_00010552, partial [Cervus elaphus hippelaphus]
MNTAQGLVPESHPRLVHLQVWGTLMIHDKEVTLEYVPSLDFWYCKW